MISIASTVVDDDYCTVQILILLRGVKGNHVALPLTSIIIISRGKLHLGRNGYGYGAGQLLYRRSMINNYKWLIRFL